VLHASHPSITPVMRVSRHSTTACCAPAALTVGLLWSHLCPDCSCGVNVRQNRLVYSGRDTRSRRPLGCADRHCEEMVPRQQRPSRRLAMSSPVPPPTGLTTQSQCHASEQQQHTGRLQCVCELASPECLKTINLLLHTPFAAHSRTREQLTVCSALSNKRAAYSLQRTLEQESSSVDRDLHHPPNQVGISVQGDFRALLPCFSRI
jgi:hypothetical protein